MIAARSPPRDADPPCDRDRGPRVIAGDDDDPDSGLVAAGDRLGDPGPRRVEHRHQAEQRQVGLRARAGRLGVEGTERLATASTRSPSSA